MFGGADRTVNRCTCATFRASWGRSRKPDASFENREFQIYTWTQNHDLLLRLARRGAGRAVLPLFVGDADAGLVREDEIIDELDHDLWIVANADDRHRPEVRSVMDRLADIRRLNEKRFAGAV